MWSHVSHCFPCDHIGRVVTARKAGRFFPSCFLGHTRHMTSDTQHVTPDFFFFFFFCLGAIICTRQEIQSIYIFSIGFIFFYICFACCIICFGCICCILCISSYHCICGLYCVCSFCCINEFVVFAIFSVFLFCFFIISLRFRLQGNLQYLCRILLLTFTYWLAKHIAIAIYWSYIDSIVVYDLQVTKHLYEYMQTQKFSHVNKRGIFDLW